MPKPYSLIPIHLEALFCSAYQAVAEPRINFDRLPYFDGVIDRNTAVPYLGEEIQSIPFRNDSIGLKKGLHLHWHLPEAFTKSKGQAMLYFREVQKLLSESEAPLIWDRLIEKKMIKTLVDGQLASIMITPEHFRRMAQQPARGLEQLGELEELFLPRNTQFPPAPNRWILLKSTVADPDTKEVIILESDFLHPYKKGDPHDSVPFPVGYDEATGTEATNPPFRYMGGKTYSLEDWNKGPSPKSEYLDDPLTVLGYGDPTFAAFYPSCRGVFGWHDDTVDEKTDNLIYEIIGFYSDPKWDYLELFIKDFLFRVDQNMSPDSEEPEAFLTTLQRNLEKYLHLQIHFNHLDEQKVNDDISAALNEYKKLLAQVMDPAYQKSLKDLSNYQKVIDGLKSALENLHTIMEEHMLPINSVLYGKILYQKGKVTSIDNQVEIAIGNTGTEALSAFLNNKMTDDGEDEPLIEEFLESLQFSSKLEHLASNVIERFKELRHERGFVSEMGGTRWIIRTMDASSPQQNTTDESQFLLPDEISVKLHQVNKLQRKADRLQWQLNTQKNQTYADWTKYMVCQYPPDVWEEDYPDIDQVRHLISSTGLFELERLEKELKECKQKVFKLLMSIRKDLLDLQLVKLNEITDAGEFIKSISSIEAFSDLEIPRELLEDPKDQDRLEELVRLINIGLQDKDLFFKTPLNQLSSAAIEGLRRLRENRMAGNEFRHNRLILQSLVLSLRSIPFYVVQPLGDSRFWQPENPVVLLAGDAMESHPRHGMDEVLACIIVMLDLEQNKVSRETLDKISLEAESMLDPDHHPYPFIGKVENGHAKHPLFLDWLINFHPTSAHIEQKVQNAGYPKDYITSQFDLHPNEPFLIPKENIMAEGGHSYWGSAILTAQAGKQLDQEIMNFIKKLLEFMVQNMRKEERPDYGLLLNTEGTKEMASSDLLELISAHLDKDFDSFFVWYLQFSEDQLLEDFYMKNPMFKGQDTDWYLDKKNREAFFHSFFQSFPPQRFDDLTPKKHYESWYFVMAIFAYERLQHTHYMSQALDGFNQALLMFKTGFQLNIEDPIGFQEYQEFTKKISDAIGKFNHASVLPGNPFFPIRSGVLKLGKLRLIDTFGVEKDIEVINPISGKKTALSGLYNSEIITADPLNGKSFHEVLLRPRFLQPGRLNFRWRSEIDDALEVSNDPLSNPICGWVLLNEIDESLMIYEQNGNALGYIDKEGRWRLFPGHAGPILPGGIDNPHLRQMVHWVCEKAAASKDEEVSFMDHFFDRLQKGIDNIEATEAEQFEGTSLLMSHPLALVRASIQIELKGESAKHQGWEPLKKELRQVVQGQKVMRESLGFENIAIPFRLGEHHKLNDGLVAFWLDDEKDNYRNDTFYSPLDPQIFTIHADTSETIHDRSGIHLSMLIDPRGSIHATTGFFPVKTLEMAPQLYRDTLKAMEVVFLTAPLLTQKGMINISLPKEEGFAWSWISPEKGDWKEITTEGHISLKDFQQEFGPEAIQIWLQLVDNKSLQPLDENEALITLQKGVKTLEDLFPEQQEALLVFFRSRMIGFFQNTGKFNGPQELREGWLKLRPSNKTDI